VDELVGLCGSHSMPAIAITDTANLFGVLEFSMSSAQLGIQPIVGSILGIAPLKESTTNTSHPDTDWLVLLVQNEIGYRNLLKLSSAAYLSGEYEGSPCVSYGQLKEHAEGLIALTGGPSGPINKLLSEHQIAAAQENLHVLAKIFPGKLYIELQRHGLPDESSIESVLLDLAYEINLPIVATNDVYFADESMWEAHDALICISDGTYLSQSDRRRFTAEHRFKSDDEMRSLFHDLPEAIDNTVTIAKRCAYRPLPHDPIFPVFPLGPDTDVATELQKQACKGLEECLERHVLNRCGTDNQGDLAVPYRERLEFELSVITEMGFAGYFLIVADFIGFAKRSGIPVGPGRGSGAGSVVAWSLGITDIDPLRFGLLFERFLNPERISMPDFDVDFCQEGRDEVLRYVENKYGRDRVAQIITFGKLQARAALRDVGRVLEMPYGQVDRICKMVPNNPANPVKLAEAVAGEPQLQEMRDTEESVAHLLDIALKLEGLYRHASTHAAGVVIGDRPLEALVPLYRDPRSTMPVTQFSMKYAEAAGLVKFDFLGLKTLTVLNRTLRLLNQRDINIKLADIPLDDARTFELLSRGESVGVFQLEGSGMRQVLVDMKPDTFDDIIALVALYRPGPMENIPRYIACKKGLEEPETLHPIIAPILQETYGVIIYQEQVMEIAQVLAGYSLGDADVLRRAMGKKIKSEMDSQLEIFVEGAVANGVDRGRAKYIFDLVSKFAGYGFNKSHAACYAMIAYQTAWLKANYPVEFLAASMTLDMGNTDKLGIFKKEAERMGMPLRHPDINRSEVEFSVETGSEPRGAEGAGIRYALAAIKNVGRQAMEAIVVERSEGGLFRSLSDFAGRIDPRVINKRQIENLARAGAFDSLNQNRAQVWSAVEHLLRHANLASESRTTGQENLFAESGHDIPDILLPDVEEWVQMERLSHEKDAVGFYLSSHPLEVFGRLLERLSVRTYGDAQKVLNGADRPLQLAGTVEGLQERTSAKGNRYAFIQLSDPSGSYEVTIFSELLSLHRDLLWPGTNLLLSVESRGDGDGGRLRVQSLRRLESIAIQARAGLRISVDDTAPIKQLSGMLDHDENGSGGRVSLVLRLDGGLTEVEIELPEKFDVSLETQESLARTPGVLEVLEI
jgi:DNA polymerase-3 subunit alpha